LTTAIATKVDFLSKALSLTQDDVGRLLNASPRAVSRWRAGESKPHRSTRQRLFELVYVGERLSKLLKPEYANAWIFSPNRLLDGDTPAQRIERGDFESVLGLIEALEEGIVV
jgi:transcriptional regulator with XRE-family HTH domain